MGTGKHLTWWPWTVQASIWHPLLGYVVKEKNRVIENRDPWAHAEINVLRKASRMMTATQIKDSTLYTSMEPCVMCAGVITAMRVKKVVWFKTDPTSGTLTVPRLSLGDHPVEMLGPVDEKKDWKNTPQALQWRKKHPKKPWARADWMLWEWAYQMKPGDQRHRSVLNVLTGTSQKIGLKTWLPDYRSLNQRIAKYVLRGKNPQLAFGLEAQAMLKLSWKYPMALPWYARAMGWERWYDHPTKRIVFHRNLCRHLYFLCY